MKEVLLNVDKFIKLNQLEEITNPVMLDRSFAPTPDGILSTQIFGSSVKERRLTFAYIDLKCHVMQPLAYKTLKRVERRIESIIAGTSKFIIDKNGELIEDEEKGNTGTEWLYENWDKIKILKNESRIRGRRVDFLTKNKRDEIFQSKAIVCPAFYRDVNLQDNSKGRPSIHKINGPYVKLIRLASLLDQGNFAFNLNNTRYQIQLTLVQLYEEFKARIEKKRGIIRQSLLGKSVDYGARVVISSGKFTTDTPSKMVTNFFHAGVPLTQCIAVFTPFFVGWIQQFFISELEKTGYKYPIVDKKTKELMYVEIKNPLVQFNDEKIHDMMKIFRSSPQQRFDTIMLETNDPEHPTVEMRFKGKFTSDPNINVSDETGIMNRPFTLTDLFYLAAVDICKDKHIYITRYPVGDYFHSFPSKINVLSTTDTCTMNIDGEIYENYPTVDVNIPKTAIPQMFTEVVTMSNTRLAGLGGDYDKLNCRFQGVILDSLCA